MLIMLFVLVYLMGMCRLFGGLLRLDCKADRVEPFIDYFIISLFWPLTVWYWMYRNYKLAWKRKV